MPKAIERFADERYVPETKMDDVLYKEDNTEVRSLGALEYLAYRVVDMKDYVADLLYRVMHPPGAKNGVQIQETIDRSLPGDFQTGYIHLGPEHDNLLQYVHIYGEFIRHIAEKNDISIKKNCLEFFIWVNHLERDLIFERDTDYEGNWVDLFNSIEKDDPEKEFKKHAIAKVHAAELYFGVNARDYVGPMRKDQSSS